MHKVDGKLDFMIMVSFPQHIKAPFWFWSKWV